jgi:hypothetical protein
MSYQHKRDRKWSSDVTENSDALDLEQGIFKSDDPLRIARSLGRSAERSDRRKASAFQSAMAMLTFYLNRAGRSLPVSQKRTLETAKDILRRVFGRKNAGDSGPADRSPGSKSRTE